MQGDLILKWGKTKRGNSNMVIMERIYCLYYATTRLSMAKGRNTPGENLCDVLNNLNIQRRDAPSRFAMKWTEAWISVSDNEEFTTALQLDVRDELLQVWDEIARDNETEDGVQDDANDRAEECYGGICRATIFATRTCRCCREVLLIAVGVAVSLTTSIPWVHSEKHPC